MCVCVCVCVEGHVAELTPLYTQNVWDLRKKRFKLWELGRKGSSCGISSILQLFLKKKDIEIYIVFLELKKLRWKCGVDGFFFSP